MMSCFDGVQRPVEWGTALAYARSIVSRRNQEQKWQRAATRKCQETPVSVTYLWWKADAS